MNILTRRLANHPNVLLQLLGMRRLFPYVAVLMVYQMTPGAGELTENIVHLVTSGHTAHTLHDGHQEPTSDEHGCSGPFHVCECHSTTNFLVAAVGQIVISPRPIDDPARHTAHTKADGFVAGVFRPPIA